MESAVSAFSGPQAASGYAERTARLVPGLADLHRMSALLLAERVPEDGHVLVLGAGGGLELKAFAESQPHWRFTGVDPSPEMLELARATLSPLGSAWIFSRAMSMMRPWARSTGRFDSLLCISCRPRRGSGHWPRCIVG